MKTAIVGLVCLLGAAGWARGDTLQVRCTDGPTQVVSGDVGYFTAMVWRDLPVGAEARSADEEARRIEGAAARQAALLAWTAYSPDGVPVTLTFNLGPGWTVLEAEGPRLLWITPGIGKRPADLRGWPVRLVGLREVYRPGKPCDAISLPLGVVKPGDVCIVTLRARWRTPTQ